ncbi:hypothetical protein AGMMS50229_06300 [Campylobacterota bacterium]|nr:hypothetical protein AGMMS50229_06300 [Campylobacterota bacterium]
MSLYTLIFKRKTSHKRFVIIFISALFVIVATIATILEIFAYKMLMPNLISVSNEYLLEVGNENIRVVALGTSHTGNGFADNDPDILNYGQAGDNAVTHYFKTKHLIANNDIEVLLLEFDYHNFTFGYADPRKSYSHNQYMIDEPVSRTLGDYKQGKKGCFLPSQCVIHGIATISHFISYLQGHTPSRSFSDNMTRFDRFTAEKRIKLSSFGYTQDQYIVEQLVEWYEKTIRLAQDNNITVVLIGYPFAGDFLKLFPQEYYQKFDALTDRLISQYGIEFWDYHALFADRDDLMSDATHVNGMGKIELTKLIKPRIEQILNQQPADENEHK